MVFKEGTVPWNKGLTKVIDVRMKKISDNLKGRNINLKTNFKKGHQMNIGRKYCEERNKEIGKSLLGKPKPWNRERMLREKNPMWAGGSSFESYSPEFNNKFKRAIRNRDNHECLKCGIHQEKAWRTLDVHHINYDKKLTISENCCTLCQRCNAEVNKNRQHWTKFFQSLLAEKYKYQYGENQEIKLNLEMGV